MSERRNGKIYWSSTHQIRHLQMLLSLGEKTHRYTSSNVVWPHYSGALMHKIFGFSINAINNLMRIHCLLMIGSVLSNDFPLILIIISNVLGLRGLNSLDRRGDGIRTFTTKRISKSRTISDGCYMCCAQSVLLLSPSLLLELYLST